MNELWSEMANRTEPYQPGEQATGLDCIKLNTNENPYPPSPRVFEALQQALSSDLRKYPEADPQELRQTLADFHEVTAEQIFIGNGSDEVLAFAFMAFFSTSKPILFPKITYSFYPTYAALFNIPYTCVPLCKNFTLDVEALSKSEGESSFRIQTHRRGLYHHFNRLNES